MNAVLRKVRHQVPSRPRRRGGDQSGGSRITIRPVRLLRISAQPKDWDFGMMRIVSNTQDLEARFRRQTFNFVCMAVHVSLPFT